MLSTALEGGQQQNHDGWLEPGIWPAAAKRRESRGMAWARVCRREAQIRNPLVIYSTWRGHQQLKNANHDGRLEPGRADGRRSPLAIYSTWLWPAAETRITTAG